jgi:Ca-activated chloride channel homolog
MFRLENPEYLYLYLLVPVFIILFALLRIWKKRSMKKFGELRIIARLFDDVSIAKSYVKFILLMLAFCAFVFAASQPQLGTKLEEVKREGIDVVIALDVSNSMNAEDIRPSRLERSKQAIFRLISQLEGDRIGLIVFAGQAYVQLPITTDYGAAKLFLSTVSSSMVPTQGTAIGAAIRMGMKSIGDSLRANSAIVVITDGENHEDDATAAASEAASKGIVVHTVGMGSPDGTPIPVYRNQSRSGFLQDRSGSTVITRLNEAMLQQIADAGKGKYVRATNSDDGVTLITREIQKMEKKEFSSKVFTSYEDQYQYFLALGMILLLIEFVISERKTEWIRKINLFGSDERKPV